jgi:protein ImuB
MQQTGIPRQHGSVYMGSTMNRPAVYLCLCVHHFYVQALLRFHPHAAATPVAIMDGDSATTMIVDLNQGAMSRGSHIGMSAVQASLDPDLLLLQRSPTQEALTREELIQTCIGITPLIEDCSDNQQCVLVMDITASLNLFGDVQCIIGHLLTSLHGLKLQANIAVASNFHTSVLLAKSQFSQPFIFVPEGKEKASLSRLPVSSLDLDSYQHETFVNWGIHTLEELAALPLTELVSRMGQPAKTLYEFAHGTHSHIFRPIALTGPLKEFVSFDSPVDLFESLLFSLAPMLEKLIARAQEEMQAIATLTFAMTLTNRKVHLRTIQPAIPSTSSKLLLKLLQLDMDAHPPDAAVTDLSLTATLDHSRKTQLGIFSPQHPDASQLRVTLARIRKIVGATHAGSPLLEDSHRKWSFLLHSFTVQEIAALDSTDSDRCVAMRRMREANRIAVTLIHETPAVFSLDGLTYRVDSAYGPWMNSGKWWNEKPWNLSQWDIIATATDQEQHLHCCLSHDRLSGAWTLDGLYD